MKERRSTRCWSPKTLITLAICNFAGAVQKMSRDTDIIETYAMSRIPTKDCSRREAACGSRRARSPYMPEERIGGSPRIRSTTVLCVRRNGKVVMAGDGQVTLGDHVIKQGARKI